MTSMVPPPRRDNQAPPQARVEARRLEPSSLEIARLCVWLTFGAAWLGFAAALAFSPDALDAAWQYVTQLPPPLQWALWPLIYPVMLGLWIWEAGWPVLLRTTLIGCLAVGTLYAFFPGQE